MSREIKFRAFYSGKMIDLQKITPLALDEPDMPGLFIPFKEGCHLMQFTGLKDKNGKEIYEGDVVKFHYFYASGGLEGFREAEHELSGVVKWGSFGWGVEAIKGEHWEGYTGYNAGEGDANFMELLAMNESGIHEESFEVIGNIWENPELLTPLLGKTNG